MRFGMVAESVWMVVAPRISASSAETMSMAMGTFWAFSSRRWAVTVTSSRVTFSEAGSAASKRVVGDSAINPAHDADASRHARLAVFLLCKTLILPPVVALNLR